MFFIEDYPPPPLKTDPQFLRALAVAPDRDDDAVDLIQRHFALQAEIDEFGARIGELIAKHAGDEQFRQRCLNALEARADLTSLLQRELLRAYLPPLHLICLDN